MPSNNRLISRVHAKVRYLANEIALEVKCLGYNGISLNIADQTMYIRRNTGIMVQLHEECEIGLDIAGSLVDIVVPSADPSEESHVLAPSSPGMPASESWSHGFANNETESEEIDQRSISQIEPLSPLPSSTGMVTPGVTPNVERIKVLEPQSSPAHVHEFHLSQPEESPAEEDKALQPRLLNFQSVSKSSPFREQTGSKGFETREKENIPPLEIRVEREATPVLTNQPEPVDSVDPITHSTTAALDNLIDEVLAEPTSGQESKSDVQVIKTEAQAPGTSAVSPPHEGGVVSEEVLDLDNLDQEFIDMILTVLATSVINPAPISLLTPFFPPETKVAEIERFLRTQSCITERVLKNDLAETEASTSSSWSYHASNDTDPIRRDRLARLQAPQRTLRKRTYQQMHTYGYEHAKYVMDCKAAGIKPVRFDGVRYRGTHSQS
ncbi:protein of unknown function [Taphrina deformans PYCC 5710]|uniref:FHA domain-containing protein n=1 Tax=Taphrina deformans (strain PYCC 5710 / ATCC 11124 / CBS 356.35 / IMI 108563 / JCM 9778 / NBRC 8474) TaxID=1097556 RepID=R4X963_TAPDE|nr:protein of unknown function [Taphrina deformans PYCC 5710]|eukprot:CCG81965.1 protein of unknown function [Taphrina deformans PYCC 5710]